MNPKSPRIPGTLFAYAPTRGPYRIFAVTTKGSTRYSDVQYAPGDLLLFGPETRGLPDEILATLPAGQKIRLPMLPDSRSLNLSNAVSVVVYEAWRQSQFEGGV